MLRLALPIVLAAVTRGALGAPYTPSGGLGFNSTPLYQPMSDFDFQSLVSKKSIAIVCQVDHTQTSFQALALHQEYIELDLFHHGLAMFSDAEFEAAGLGAHDRFLIEFMADQEVGHAILISNILGRTSAQLLYCNPLLRQFVRSGCGAEAVQLYVPLRERP